MRVFHTTQADATTTNATMERLRHAGATDFEPFEGALHALFMAAGREVLATELERLEVSRPQWLIDGRPHHRVLRSSETYTSAAGPVTVMGRCIGAGAIRRWFRWSCAPAWWRVSSRRGRRAKRGGR